MKKDKSIILELMTVKNYCLKSGYSDAGVRKKIASGSLVSLTYDELLYVALPTYAIATLETKVKTLRAQVKQLKTESRVYVSQDNLIQELKDEVSTLKESNRALQDAKDSLYEKVIGQQDRMFDKYEALLLSSN